MSGFFKKLFNRITGKKDEAAPEVVAPEVVVEQVALPAPEIVDDAVAAKKPAAKKSKVEIAPKAVAKKSVAEGKVATKKAAPSSPKTKPAQAPVAKPVAAKKPRTKIVAVVPPPVQRKPAVKTPTALPPDRKPAGAPPPAQPTIEEPKAAPVSPPVLPQELPVQVPVLVPVPNVAAEPVAAKGWLSRLTSGLSKSSKSISGSISAIFTKRKLDKDTLQELEDTLIQADLGLSVSERIIAEVSRGRFDKEIDPEEVKQILAAEVAKVLKPVEVPFNFGSEKPFVILVVGVNGSGKTTTIGKLGSIAAQEGFKVKFAACDTFRAAAIEQLTVWGKRIGAETISRPQGADAAGLAFDAMKAAKEDGTDILFIDTAGRLHNKAYLMDELDKVVRVIKKYDAAAPHAVLLVLDATTGQNAMAQADAFTKVAGVTGLIMTKLDGTARGGILVAIAEAFKLPIHAIGVGESIEDLQAFDADAFARAIAGLDAQ
jgi:fused signal recognition particle receptor